LRHGHGLEGDGFSDAVGNEARNASLRELRANVVSGFIEGLCKLLDPEYSASEVISSAPTGSFLNADNTKLLMHREVIRKGDPTVCPGDKMAPFVEALRTELGLTK
jgi:hypothetical protein